MLSFTIFTFLVISIVVYQDLGNSIEITYSKYVQFPYTKSGRPSLSYFPNDKRGLESHKHELSIVFSNYTKPFANPTPFKRDKHLNKRKRNICVNGCSAKDSLVKFNTFRPKLTKSFNEPNHRLSGRHIRESKHHFFLSRPLGRVGNMMFEFASSLGIAKSLNYKHIIKPSHPLLKYFDIKNVMDMNITNIRLLLEHECNSKTWRDEKKYMSYNLTLHGYFQSWKYFHNAANEVRRSFTIKTKYRHQARQFLDEHIPEKYKTLIGIHIRRGDFLTDVEKKLGRVVADKYYIEKSKRYFRQKYNNTIFVVISDDQKWCKQNVAGDDVIYSSFKEPIIDMAIMTMCQHVITTCGTFSWWCGWLSHGTVIYLKDYPVSGMYLSHATNFTKDVYMPDWIGMDNGSF